jgi:CRP/FNR family transcriptional regulator, cyclic AMP receptor protein
MNLLAKIELFEGLEPEALQALTRQLVSRSVPKNTIVISEGDTTDSLYVIVKGRVKVFVGNEQGREITLCTQGPGEYFGELALLDGDGRSASVVTMEPCQFAVIERRAFLECVAAHPTMATPLIRNLSRRIRRLTNLARNLALLDVYGRIVRTLLDLVKDEDGRRVIAEKLTHQEIANRVGASREMVSRIMKDLTDGGYVRTEAGRLILSEQLPPGW